MSAWAKPGVKCVCIATHGRQGIYGEILPTERQVLTVRDVLEYEGDTCLRFVEIVNPPNEYACGFIEAFFVADKFRPLITQEHDLKTHFEQYLKTDHRAPEKADA